jgi:hypothetical protein
LSDPIDEVIRAGSDVTCRRLQHAPVERNERVLALDPGPPLVGARMEAHALDLDRETRGRIREVEARDERSFVVTHDPLTRGRRKP